MSDTDPCGRKVVVSQVRVKVPGGARSGQPALFLLSLAQWRDRKLTYNYIESAPDAGLAKAISEAVVPVAALCAETSIWGPVTSIPRLVRAVRNALFRVSKTLLQRTFL